MEDRHEGLIGPNSLACGLAAHHGEPVLTTDVKGEPRWTDWLWMAEDFDYRGRWSFPIHTTAGKYAGSYAVYWRQPHAAGQGAIDFAAHLTRVAAIIVARHLEAEKANGVTAPKPAEPTDTGVIAR